MSTQVVNRAKPTIVHIRLTRQMRDALEKMSKIERRSLTGTIEFLVAREAEKYGIEVD